jgi:thiol-disulfide isomerase/thioredoxin
VILIIAANRGGTTVSNGQPAPVAVLHGVTTVSDKTFATVGTGDVQNPFTSVSPGVAILRDSAGKPIMLYVGAEYCPYCAAERWSMVVALSRFGSFSNLHVISSSSTDAYPNTPTFTFYKSTYTSPYLEFQPVEVQDRTGNALQSMTSAQSKLFSKYNANGSFPFIDFGNQYIAIGASYQNTVLTDQDWNSIAAQLDDPNSKVTQSIVGTANYMTAAICQLTGNQPAKVCTAAPIPTIEKTIGAPAGK